MPEAEQPRKRGSGFLRLFERGVDTATRKNDTAYGYSVTITAVFALLQTSRSDTGALEVFRLRCRSGRGLRRGRRRSLRVLSGETRDQPSNVKSLAVALSVLSVDLALAVAYVVGILIQGIAGWTVSAFLKTVVYSRGRIRVGRSAPAVRKR